MHRLCLKADAADASGPRWTDAQIAEAFFCPIKTVARIRQRVVEIGVEATLANQKEGTPAHNRLLSGAQEARIIAERLGKPPAGYANWSLRLLADRVVELQLVDSISHETIRGVLKKNQMTNRRIAYWVIFILNTAVGISQIGINCYHAARFPRFCFSPIW